MIFNVVYALGELALLYPISGGFYTYSTRFIDPSWGFAMGYNYVFQWAIVLPLELTVAALTVEYWGANVNVAVWISIFMVAIIAINIFGVLGYAEEEFWVSLLKLSTIVIFMIMGVVFACGGGPGNGMYSEYWGARTWYNPGAFNDGFLGFCSVFVTAAFSFSGAELVGLAAAETENPQKSLPGAVKQVFWRITLFYILGLFFVGLLVPYDDPRLLGSGLIDVTASPFVIVAVNAGIPAFGDFINVVILFSVISIGLSGVYGGSRTLTALAEQGYAPKIFTYVDKAGRPLFSTIIILAFGPIAYVQLASSGAEVFAWLQALSGLAALFTWGSICLAHIRFRKAWAYRGHTLDEIPFKAVFGIWGSYLGLALVVIVLAAQVRSDMTKKIDKTSANSLSSSTLPLRLSMLSPSSSPTSPSSSSSFSTRLAGCGRDKHGSGQGTSTLTPDAVRSIGRRSRRSVRRSRLGQNGEEPWTRSSRVACRVPCVV